MSNKRAKPKTLKVSVWVYIRDNSDGSSSASFFTDKHKAEASAYEDEFFNEENIYSAVLLVTEDGKFIREE